jgi:hypothetical protein
MLISGVSRWLGFLSGNNLQQDNNLQRKWNKATIYVKQKAKETKF